MQQADIVLVSYSGQRLQTFIFDETNPQVIKANKKAVTDFLAACQQVTAVTHPADFPRWTLAGVPSEVVVSLLNAYQFHEDQTTMNPGHMTGWIQRAAQGNLWNVVVLGSSKVHKAQDGKPVELGTTDIGLSAAVPAVNRAPLHEPSRGTANIKALMSHDDWFADLDRDYVRSLGDRKKYPRAIRRESCHGHGLVIVYPISKDSVPMGVAENAGSRRAMQAPDHLFGLGLIFPDVERDGHAEEGTYYSVHPDWEVAVAEDDDMPEDREASLAVDGKKAAPRS
jgi:hypothetical protein